MHVYDIQPEWPSPGDIVHYMHDWGGCSEAIVLAVTDGAAGELDLLVGETAYREVKYSVARINTWHLE
jgi:hypothetical protein